MKPEGRVGRIATAFHPAPPRSSADVKAAFFDYDGLKDS
jgi:hypothetical protein